MVQRNDGSVDPESDRGHIPAPRDEGRYAGRVFPRRQEQADIAADLAGKPVIRHALANLPATEDVVTNEHGHSVARWTGEETIRRRAEMIVLSSDNGFFFGEHGLPNEQPYPHLLDMDYRAVRTARYKYVHWVKFPAQDELYDLQTDSLERRNVAQDPGMAAVRSQLRTELGRLVVEAIGLKSP